MTEPHPSRPGPAGGSTPGPVLPRRIAHFDLDTFFVAVARLRDPSLIGRPVLVGHDGPRGVVSSASYEARRFGCRSAQPMAEAKRRCPEAVIVAPEMGGYAATSRDFHRILAEAAPLVESAGIDEAYADLTGLGPGGGAAAETARAIRRRVRAELGLAVSCCVAGSHVTAKVGSDRAKPDGMIEVPVGGDAAFLAPLPVRELPLVGPALGDALGRLGVRTIGDVTRLDPRWLERRFGKAGLALAARARGEDARAVAAGPRVAKSMSRERTFAADVADVRELRRVLGAHVESVGADLRRAGKRCRTVTIKVRWPDFTTVQRSRTLPRPVAANAALLAPAVALLDEVLAAADGRAVRLLGLAAGNLVGDAVQLALGEGDALAPAEAAAAAGAGAPPPPGADRAERVDRALDGVRARFGPDAVRRGRAAPARRGWDPRGVEAAYDAEVAGWAADAVPVDGG